MREILFRGKRVDNGKWVQGDFVSSGCGIAYTDYLNEHGDIGEVFCKAIPETVGQYTGLTDKNGKKIFEGDIVKNQYDKNKYQYFKIFYCNRTYCWRVKNKYAMSGNLCNVIGDIEVIGNIHDNPELLKEGAE